MKDGGPAFPVVHAIVPQPGHFTTTPAAQPGMSLRDYFAAKVMHAVLNGLVERAEGPTNAYELASLATRSYQMADALLAEREKGAK